MAETDQKQPAGLKRPKFVKAFIARLRSPISNANLTGRLLNAGLVVVLAGPVAFGVGAFIHHKKTSPTSPNNAGKRGIAPSPGATVTQPGANPQSWEGDPVVGLPPLGGLPGGRGATGSSSGSGSGAADAAGSRPGSAATSGSGGSGGSGSAVQSQRQPVKVRRIQSFASNRCIDVVQGQRSAGTPLQIWDCNTFVQQKWEFWSDGTLRVLGFCMTVGGTQDGASIRIQGCNGGSAQRFNLNGASDLIYLAADKCVDVKDNKTDNGALLQVWGCSGGANQKWRTV